jgi:hypothetical protein
MTGDETKRRDIRSPSEFDKFSNVAILSGAPRLPKMAEMNGVFTLLNEMRRTIVRFLKNEMDTAIKSERKAVQNRVDMERAMGTGSSSSNTDLRTVIHVHGPPPGTCRPPIPAFAVLYIHTQLTPEQNTVRIRGMTRTHVTPGFQVATA